MAEAKIALEEAVTRYVEANAADWLFALGEPSGR
jgi:hypothetical protein